MAQGDAELEARLAEQDEFEPTEGEHLRTCLIVEKSEATQGDQLWFLCS